MRGLNGMAEAVIDSDSVSPHYLDQDGVTARSLEIAVQPRSKPNRGQRDDTTHEHVEDVVVGRQNNGSEHDQRHHEGERPGVPRAS